MGIVVRIWGLGGLAVAIWIPLYICTESQFMISPPTRKATLMTLLSRPEGAALSELVAATAWQAHSVRAALTHFRLAGFTVNRTRDETGAPRYHLVGA